MARPTNAGLKTKFEARFQADHQADCIAFYLYGRTERDIENLSRSGHDFTEAALRGRISALFSSHSNGEVLRPQDTVPVLPREAAEGKLPLREPALALAEHPHANVHEQSSKQKKSSGRRTGTIMSGDTKASRMRKLIREAIEAGVNDYNQIAAYLREDTSIRRGNIYDLIHRDVRNGILIKTKDGRLLLPKTQAAGKVNGSAQPVKPSVVRPRKSLGKKLPKGETGKILVTWLKRLGVIDQQELNRRISAKYPDVPPQGFAAATNALIQKGDIIRNPDGTIYLAPPPQPVAEIEPAQDAGQ